MSLIRATISREMSNISPAFVPLDKQFLELGTYNAI